jgi:DNA-binding MarR family transcriptional regulator
MAMDVTVLAAALTSVASAKMAETLTRPGEQPIRPSWGYIIQHLIGGPLASAEIGRRLGISKQAVNAAVHELVDRGLVEQLEDRRVRLTPAGRGLIERTRRTRQELVDRLTSVVGKQDMETCRRVLLAWLEELGGLEDLRRRNLRPG